MPMKYFKIEEFACPCCGQDNMTADLLSKVDQLREYMGIPLYINSGFRCVRHNIEVGGKPDSRHLQGMAADISMSKMTAFQRHKVLEFIHDTFNGIGIGKNFVHVDTREHKAMWVY